MQANVGAGLPAKRPVQSLHLLRPMPPSTPIAGKPAPTFDRVPTLEYRLMWERACPRKGRCSHCTYSGQCHVLPLSQASQLPPLTEFQPWNCRLMWERACPRRGRCNHRLFRPMPRSTPIAGKPAPTFDRVPTLEYRLMWERACPRRGQCSHHTYSGQCHLLPLSQASPLPPLTEFQPWNTG
ncbi:hypothetical protein C4J83_0220 [Pseudomonas sp. LBUM920]|nr:hypothetical protein C4J83_0220 [Pseudomonas sp. LBUM920]